MNRDSFEYLITGFGIFLPTIVYKMKSGEEGFMSTVNALDVARLFLAWAKENGDVITNLKMQKLLYYAQAWHMVNFDKRLFRDSIEAWDLGPVIRVIYNKWKKYGASPIPYNVTGNEESQFTDHQVEFLREYFRVFSSLSATALVSMSHSEDPWKKAYVPGGSAIIDASGMKHYYKQQYQIRDAKER